jgi:hypothetical protein
MIFVWSTCQAKPTPLLMLYPHHDEHSAVELPLSSPTFVMCDELHQELQQLEEARHIIEKIVTSDP